VRETGDKRMTWGGKWGRGGDKTLGDRWKETVRKLQEGRRGVEGGVRGLMSEEGEKT